MNLPDDELASPEIKSLMEKIVDENDRINKFCATMWYDEIKKHNEAETISRQCDMACDAVMDDLVVYLHAIPKKTNG